MVDERAAFTLRLPVVTLDGLDEMAWRSRKNRNEFVVELIEQAIKNAGLTQDAPSGDTKKRRVGRPKKENTGGAVS